MSTDEMTPLPPAAQSMLALGAGRPQPAHVFLVERMESDGLMSESVSLTRAIAELMADRKNVSIVHEDVSPWRVSAYGLWGPAAWIREVTWWDGYRGWQQIRVSYLCTEDSWP